MSLGGRALPEMRSSTALALNPRPTDSQFIVRTLRDLGRLRPAASQAAVLQSYLGTLLVTVPTAVTVPVTAFVTAPHMRSTEEEMNSESARITCACEMTGVGLEPTTCGLKVRKDPRTIGVHRTRNKTGSGLPAC
jgi:hypothetical protein